MTRITSISILIKVLLILGTKSYGQNIFKENDADIVLGIETMSTFTSNILKGVIIEKPLGQFSIGANLSHTKGDYQGIDLVDKVSTRSLKTGMAINAYEIYGGRANYLVFGTELKYRLPCNCIFAYANLKQANEASKSKTQSWKTTSSQYDSTSENLKNSNLLYGFGLGANLHFSKYFRAVFKIGNERTEWDYGSRDARRDLIRFSAGLHYGFSR